MRSYEYIGSLKASIQLQQTLLPRFKTLLSRLCVINDLREHLPIWLQWKLADSEVMIVISGMIFPQGDTKKLYLLQCYSIPSTSSIRSQKKWKWLKLVKPRSWIMWSSTSTRLKWRTSAELSTWPAASYPHGPEPSGTDEKFQPPHTPLSGAGSDRSSQPHPWQMQLWEVCC